MEGVNIVQILAWSGFVNGIFSLALGLFVLGTDWKKKSNRLFLVVTVFIAVWSFNYSRWLALDSDPNAIYNAGISLFWSRWLNLASIWIPVTFIHWFTSSFDFDPKSYRHVRYVLIGGYALAALVSVSAWTPLFISQMKPEMFFRFWPRPGILYTLYVIILYFGLACGYFPFLVYKKYQQYKKEAPSEIRGFVLLSIGMMIGFFGGATNFPLWYDIPIPPYGNLLVSLWVLIAGYATIRYNAFHFKKVVAAELLVGAIWLFLLSRMFITILNSSILNAMPDIAVFLGSIVIGIFLIRSVLDEVKQREKSEELTREVEDKNLKLNEKTLELNNELAEIERMNKYMVDRELKMVELKKRLEEAESKLAGR